MPESMALCEWCRERRVERRGARYCSHTCRQRAYEFRAQIMVALGLIRSQLASASQFLDALQGALIERHIINAPTRKEVPK